MQATHLRPLGVGELVDGAISLCRAHLKTLLVTTGIAIIPAAVVTALVQTWVDARIDSGDQFHMSPSIAGVVMMIAVAFGVTAAVHASGQAFLGATPHWFDSISVTVVNREVRKVTLIVGLCTALGVAILFVPAVWVVAAWSLAAPIVLFEGRDAKSALERSRRLSFRDWHVPALLSCGFVAAMLLAGLLSGLADLTGLLPSVADGPAEFVRYFVAAAVVPMAFVPVSAAVITVAYVDRVLRAGELDLDLIGKHLDVEVDDQAGVTVMNGVAEPVLRDPIDHILRRGERDFRCFADKTRELLDQLRRPSERGEPAMPIEPDRPLAIMFTDVDGSTPLTESLGDLKAREVLRGHEELVHSGIRAWGGRAVRQTGDGVMACFPSATQALECALMIEREQDVRNGVVGEPISVRIGINAGEPVAENGDLFGVAVNVARSILDVAQPGQVLVSEVVRQLAAGKGFVFEDCGARPLDGLSEPVRLYALVAR